MTRHSLDIPGADESDTNFSFLLGGGISYGLNERWDLTAGIQFHQTRTGGEDEDEEGDVNDEDEAEIFVEDDNAKFVLFTVGVRFR
jgi:opacity protein-like surface antigen